MSIVLAFPSKTVMVLPMQEGVIFAMITSVLWGITPILDKLSVMNASPASVLVVRFTTTFLCVIPIFCLPTVRSEVLNMDRRTILCIVSAAVLSAIFGIFLYYASMKTLEASRVTPICAIYPLVTFLLGWAFLHERLTLTKALGTIFTVAGVVLVSL